MTNKKTNKKVVLKNSKENTNISKEDIDEFMPVILMVGLLILTGINPFLGFAILVGGIFLMCLLFGLCGIIMEIKRIFF